MTGERHRTTSPASDVFFHYSFDRLTAGPLRVAGIRHDRDGVVVGRDRILATFGYLHLSVPITNIEQVEVTGPYRWYRVLGPRLSAADHGITFGTNSQGGVCMTFIDTVPAVFGPWRHPGLTVTVADPQALADLVTERIAGRR